MGRRPVGRNGKAIAVTTYGPGGASTRVRIYDWAQHCAVPMIRSNYVGTADNQPGTLLKRLPQVLRAEFRLRRLANHISDKTVIISRQASPFSSGRLEERLLRNAAHSVYDFDDALKFDTGSRLRKLWSKEKVWIRAVQSADVVIAGSEILAEQAREFSDNVVMIPSCVEPENYVRKSDYLITDAPRAVWIGSPATEPLLRIAEDALLQLHREFGLRLSVISGGNTSLGALDAMVDRSQWTINGFPELLAAADFGIMPLNDTPYNRGKCSYKLLQYASTGLPVIGSPVGTNNDALRKLGGMAATSAEEWVAAGTRLISMDAFDREALGAEALKGVTEHFSFSAWEGHWMSAMALQAVSPAESED